MTWPRTGYCFACRWQSAEGYLVDQAVHDIDAENVGQFIEQDVDLAAQSGSRERAEVRDFKAQHALKTADFSQPLMRVRGINLAVEVFPVGFELTHSIKDFDCLYR